LLLGRSPGQERIDEKEMGRGEKKMRGKTKIGNREKRENKEI
jgi:hypothetical protein